MPGFLKVRIPVIVTADKKWAAQGGSSYSDEEIDWGWIEEMCNQEKALVSPQRFWVEALIEIPETKEARGIAIPVAASL